MDGGRRILFAFLARWPAASEPRCWMKTVLSFSIAAICGVAACGCRKSPLQSSSMAPTITNGEKVIVDYTAYLLSKPKRWEVAVFDGPTPISSTNPAAKRVIALPLETISFNSNGIVVNGRSLGTPPALSNFVYYPPEKWPDQGSLITFPYTVPAKQYFVLGDNMANSLDSRYYGAVSETNLLGRVKKK